MKKNSDALGSETGDSSFKAEHGEESVLPGTLSAKDLAAAKERISKMVILDKKGLEAARAKAKAELGAGERQEQGSTGDWDGRTQAQIKTLRDKHNLGEFNATYEIGIANLATQQLVRIDGELQKVSKTGAVGGSDKSRESLMKERTKYQEMLEATPPEARPTTPDSQLEAEERLAKTKFNQLADRDQSVGVSKFIEMFTGPKQESSEVKGARKTWKLAKARKEENEARKILNIAEAMDLPSDNDADFKIGQTVGEWQVAYITSDKSLSAQSKVILQKGEGQDSQLIMKNLGEMKLFIGREKYLADHPEKRGEEDL